MARIDYIEEDNAKGIIKENYEQFKDELGFVPNIFKSFSTWNDLFRANVNLYNSIMNQKSELDRSTKEMIAYVTSKLNNCSYCSVHHFNFMKRYGVDDSVANKIKEDCGKASLNERTSRLLRYVEKVTSNAYKITSDDFDSLHKVGWSEKEIIETTSVAALFNYLNRLADAFGVKLEKANNI